MAVGSFGLLSGFLFSSVAPAGASEATNQYSLNQCANGPIAAPASCSDANYQNGDLNKSNSHWAEGEFVPFQLLLTGITAGDHTVAIQYEVVNGTKHAYDYLGSFDATESTGGPGLAHANGNNPCSTLIPTCNVADPLTTNMPAPDLSAVNPTCNSTGTPPATLPANRVFSLWGPTGSSLISAAPESPEVQTVQAGKTVTDCRTVIDVKFHSPGDGSSMVLAWSGHVASELDWGAGTGAGSISGSPYHMWVVGLDGSGGSQERSMKVTASAPTLATVIKDAAGDPITSVPAGTSIHDTATLAGASSTAGGTVTYQLFDNGTCGPDADPIRTDSVTVTNGTVPDSPPFTATAPEYSYLATYSGDGTNEATAGVCEGPLGVTQTQTPQAIINVVKSEPTPGAGQTVTAGQNNPITYKLAVTNSGAGDATNVVVTDVIPQGTSYVPNSAASTPAVASISFPTGAIQWTIPTVPAASGTTPGEVDLTFEVMVDSTDKSGSTIVNQGVFTDVNTPGCNPGTAELTCLTNTVSNPVTAPQPSTTPQQAAVTTVPPTSTTTVATTALAFTGSRTAGLTALGLGLVASGGLVLLLNRRRRRGEA